MKDRTKENEWKRRWRQEHPVAHARHVRGHYRRAHGLPSVDEVEQLKPPPLSDDVVRHIKQMLRNGWRNRDIGEELSISEKLVSLIKLGKRHRDIT